MHRRNALLFSGVLILLSVVGSRQVDRPYVLILRLPVAHLAILVLVLAVDQALDHHRLKMELVEDLVRVVVVVLVEGLVRVVEVEVVLVLAASVLVVVVVASVSAVAASAAPVASGRPWLRRLSSVLSSLAAASAALSAALVAAVAAALPAALLLGAALLLEA